MSSTHEPDFKLRFMEVHEAQRVAELIKQLQNYQRKEGVTELPGEDHIRAHLCHESPTGSVIPHDKGTFTLLAVKTVTGAAGAQAEELAIGYLIYSLKFSLTTGSQFYINSFFIEQPYRRHGLGRRMIRFIQSHAKLLGMNQFDVPFMKNNLIGQEFYNSFGAYLVGEEYHLLEVKPAIEQ